MMDDWVSALVPCHLDLRGRSWPLPPSHAGNCAVRCIPLHQVVPLTPLCFQPSAPLAGGGNPNHFLVATQDRDLQQRIMSQPGGAVLFTSVHGVGMAMPSTLQKEGAAEQGSARLRPSAAEKRTLEGVGRPAGEDDGERRGPKTPFKCVELGCVHGSLGGGWDAGLVEPGCSSGFCLTLICQDVCLQHGQHPSPVYLPPHPSLTSTTLSRQHHEQEEQGKGAQPPGVQTQEDEEGRGGGGGPRAGSSAARQRRKTGACAAIAAATVRRGR